MAKGVFVTGNGTGIGKTYVAALLLKKFSGMGLGTTYMKPVETGCKPSPDGATLVDSDTVYALGFASCKTAMSLHAPYRFSSPSSPHLAARENEDEIKIEEIVQTYESLQKNTAADIVVVEGAGGVLVPISNKEYIVDIMRALRIPAILVADPGLGALNHTFLSLCALERYAVPVAGVVINNTHNIGRDVVYDDNVRMIRQHVYPLPCLDLGYDDTQTGRAADNEQLTGFCDEIISGI
jgi:dethiobiotin synthetase